MSRSSGHIQLDFAVAPTGTVEEERLRRFLMIALTDHATVKVAELIGAEETLVSWIFNK